MLLLSLLLLAPTDAWATQGSWALLGTNYGICAVNNNKTFPANGLGNNSGWGDYSITNRDDLGAVGCQGTQFAGKTTKSDEKFISISRYKQTYTVPAYTQLVRTSTFKVCMASARYRHGAGLYIFDTDNAAYTTSLDAMPYQDQATLSECVIKATDHDGSHTWSQNTKVLTFDNTTSANPTTFERFVAFMHVTCSYSNPNADGLEWAGFIEDDYTEQYTPYNFITYDANGGTGSMAQQTIAGSGTLSSNAFTRSGYHMTGWNTQANGTGTAYAKDAPIEVTDQTKGPITLYAQWEANNISYRTPAYNTAGDATSGIASWSTQIAVSAVEITSSNQTATWSTGWYYVAGNVTLSEGAICNGDVHLILCDGANLTIGNSATTFRAGILVSGSNSLTVYAQSEGDNMGTLTATGGYYAAGIGGDGNSSSTANGSNITINGGRIVATHGDIPSGYGSDAGSGAGIGGGKDGDGQNITINAGNVTANGGKWAAGIGGGYDGHGSNITINGGDVTANGGLLSAGIGGGDGKNGTNIRIGGGTVRANGDQGAAGIGGGYMGSCSNITINSNYVVMVNGAQIENNGGDLSSDLQGRRYVTIHNQHTYTPSWAWEEDGSSATVTFKCSFGESIVLTPTTTPAVVISYANTVASTCTTTGSRTCNAYVVFNDTRYDAPELQAVLPALSHHFDENGVCTNQGCTAQLSYRTPTYNTAGDATSGIASWSTQMAAGATALTSSDEPVTLSAGWYYVSGYVTLEQGAICSGDVHILLCDGATLKATNPNRYGVGIRVVGSNSLTVYAQSEGENMGALTASGGELAAGIGGSDRTGAGQNITINGGRVTATGGNNGAGIGGANGKAGQNITINGGNVTANGGKRASGIGGGYEGAGKNITINGGEVKAYGYSAEGYGAAGIGGGNNGSGSDITINGGKVTAIGGASGAGIGGGPSGIGSNISIRGGEVTANGGRLAAGIGGGNTGSGSDITISGGKVTAQGGASGAGIGGGYGEAGSNITINGGTVHANGGSNAAGIGGGWNAGGSYITINDGTIIAQGGYGGAGIGGGYKNTNSGTGNGSNIIINGGDVTANGGDGGAGIGGGYGGYGRYITIEGGTVTATGNNGAGIGGGYEGSGTNITICNACVVSAGASAQSTTDVTQSGTDYTSVFSTSTPYITIITHVYQLASTPDANGLYSYVCPRNSAHILDNVKVLKDYANGSNLDLTVADGNYSTDTEINLTDENQLKNVSVSFTTPNNPTYTRLGISKQWGTIVLPFRLELPENEVYDFYEVSSVTAEGIVLAKLTGELAAGTPALVRIDAAEITGKTYDLSLTAADNIISTNVLTQSGAMVLTGSFYAKDITSEQGYIIANNAFWNIQQVKGANNVYCAPFRTYLAGTLGGDEAPMRLGLSTASENTTTALSDIESQANNTAEAMQALLDGTAQIYDLSGRRINQLQQGVNIVAFGNGQSVKIYLK